MCSFSSDVPLSLDNIVHTYTASSANVWLSRLETFRTESSASVAPISLKLTSEHMSFVSLEVRLHESAEATWHRTCCLQEILRHLKCRLPNLIFF